MDLEDDVDDDKTLFTLLKRQVSNFFMRLIWYTKLADFVRYINVLAIFDDTLKTSKMTESWLWIYSKKLSVMQCVLRKYDLTSFIFGKLL